MTISSHEKTIFAAYFHPDKGFYWLLAEPDEMKLHAAGYFVGHEVEGWGTVDLEGVKRHGAIQILPWEPCGLLDAANRLRQHLRSTTKFSSDRREPA